MKTSTAGRRRAARHFHSWRNGALGAVAVALASIAPVTADAADAGGSLKAAGKLTLSLGNDPDQFQWIANDGTTVLATQLVKDKRDITNAPKDACVLALLPSATSSDALVNVEARSTKNGSSMAATPGFNAQKNWGGVAEQAKGVDCGRVSPQQSVLLSLVGRLNGRAVSHTKFQVNVKKNVVIKAHLTLKGANAKDFYLYTGLSTVGAPPDNGDTVQYCEAGISDSSPDSSANCVGTDQWEFDWLWDRAEFSTVGSVGEWSLAGPTMYEFQLVEADGVLACGDTTVAVGDGIAQPFAQCTRLANGPSTLPGGPTSGDNCQVVGYSLDSNCSGSGCKVTLLHGLSGTQDPTQFRFLCTINWVAETVPNGGSPQYLSNLPLTQQFWGPDDSASTRALDYCPGATVVTSPLNCEPGVVAVTSSSLSYASFLIQSGEGGLDAFRSGDVITLSGVVGYYKVASATAFSLSLDPADSPLASSGSNVAGTITRVSGCPIVEFSFANIPADLRDMSETLPGEQRGCLLREQFSVCSTSGVLKACGEQVLGVEGDAAWGRF
jgi:hypothetical protein